MAKKNARTRNWAIIVYPDSAPDNWLDVISDLHTPSLLSPLHDKDKRANGEDKKPHYHLLLMFDSVKTYEQVSEICEMLKAPIPQRVQSVKGYARYLVHMDDPDKHQYDRDDIRAFAGADVAELLKPTAATRYEMIAEMRRFVSEYNITEFYELFDYAEEHRRDDWFPLLCDNSAYVLGQYIKSKRFAAMADSQASWRRGAVRVAQDDVASDDAGE